MPAFLVSLATENSDFFSGGMFRATLGVLATSPCAASLPIAGPECMHIPCLSLRFLWARYCLVSQEKVRLDGTASSKGDLGCLSLLVSPAIHLHPRSPH